MEIIPIHDPMKEPVTSSDMRGVGLEIRLLKDAVIEANKSTAKLSTVTIWLTIALVIAAFLQALPAIIPYFIEVIRFVMKMLWSS